jgi:hypothetical protein
MSKELRARGTLMKNWMAGIKKVINERRQSEGKLEDRKKCIRAT